MDNAEALSSIKCFICGAQKGFIAPKGSSLREATCLHCGSSLRNSDVAKVLIEYVGPRGDHALDQAQVDLCGISIYEAQAGGPIHKILQGCQGYVCSEFSETNPNFQFEDDNVRSENLECLSFSDNSFDVVITQDVFEHLKNPYDGFREVRRVLKPGGIHIFTIPFHHGQPTKVRATFSDGIDTFLLPPVYHGDAFKRCSSLVYTDFGDDMFEMLANLGLPTHKAVERCFYQNDQIPRIDDKNSHDIYMDFEEKDRVLEFFLYNSIVFVSIKKDDMKTRLDPTGERFLPWLTDPKIHYEHLHRYWFAMELAQEKSVLDLASGEGYGSFMLSSKATEVCGVDIDSNAVEHAAETYRRNNLRYLKGSILELPLDNDERFDLIVCFEALEHVMDHDLLIAQVKAHLSPGGTFIVSTPNKGEYSDVDNFSNPYHVKELYLAEFQALLESNFRHVTLFGQKLINGSKISPLGIAPVTTVNAFIEEKGGYQGYRFVTEDKFVPEYYIAVVSDTPIRDVNASDGWDLLDVSCSLHLEKQRLDKQFNNYIHQSESVILGLEKKLKEQESIIKHQEKQLEHQIILSNGQEREIAMMQQSKAWRAAEFFREIVYRRLLRR